MNFTSNDDNDSVEVPFGKSLGFKELVLLHLKQTMSLSCVEFRGGFWTSHVNKDGSRQALYIADTRAVFQNAVHILALILQPKFDDVAKEGYTSFIERLTQSEEKFIQKSSVPEEIILGEDFYSSEEDKLLLEQHKQDKLLIYMDLFAVLSNFLSRENYFNLGGGTF